MTYPTPNQTTLNIVCFDFDGILAENTWPLPDIGAPIPEGVEMLKHYYEADYAIKIHTARPKAHEPAIAAWLNMHGLAHMVYEIVGGKPIAALYIDDRAFRPPWVDKAQEAKDEQLREDARRALEGDGSWAATVDDDRIWEDVDG